MRCISALSLAAFVSLSMAQQKSSTTAKRDVSLSCLVFQDLSFYDIRPIQSKTNDYSVQSATNENETYYFNLCG